MGDGWDPQLYLKFRRQRDEPFGELVELLKGPFGQARVVDLGCGDGHLTARLHDFLKPASMMAVDSSPAMLKQAPQRDGLDFVEADMLSVLEPGRWDIIFSHAALQWVDEQSPLFQRLYTSLRPGGQLAVQMPANHDATLHEVAREIARRHPYRDLLRGYNRELPVLPPESYAMILADLGFAEQRVSLRVFMHRLNSVQELGEWARGTFMTGYRERLDGDAFDRFFAEYLSLLEERMAQEQPHSRGGKVWLPFKRLLIWARKPELLA